ncbi:hypothetical protein [Arthrobacter bambusae]|uniref:hypothetical protein n=1 Tax=Arthrobacter bambusae TaxID=1338426 RepID=UPI0027854DBA|nr:hypothetical protein [Arthrobacter bambusae]MDQ0212643.1 hypothetical protein [Arthrobacter bambusae]MDQ0237080.1 hypothetical protein [Arthrobacter bambusae]
MISQRSRESSELITFELSPVVAVENPGPRKRNLRPAEASAGHNGHVIMFAKVLTNILFVAGFLAIAVLAAEISYYGKPEVGLSIIVIACALLLMQALATAIVNTRQKRAIKAAQEAKRANASAPPTTHNVQATEAFDYDVQTVWSLIRPAESAVLLTDAQRAFTVPGTPTGVGESSASSDVTAPRPSLKSSARKVRSGRQHGPSRPARRIPVRATLLNQRRRDAPTQSEWSSNSRPAQSLPTIRRDGGNLMHAAICTG